MRGTTRNNSRAERVPGRNSPPSAHSRWPAGIALAVALGLTVAILAPRLSGAGPGTRLGLAGDAAGDPIVSGPSDGEVGVADGLLTGPASPFDLGLPAIANLDPDLRRALQQAASTAWTQGVAFHVTSGWRSPDYQQQLLDEAIMTHASEAEALRWVATPEDSGHVTGDAVDIGPADATDWLRQRGANFGLCQTYANEGWHFELRTTPGGECPPMRPDAAS